MLNSTTSNPDQVGTTGPALQQSLTALATSASAADTLMTPVFAPPCASNPEQCLMEQIQALQNRLDDQPAPHSCRVVLKIGFFFDGTGNNLDADIGTDEHSNVARLFKAYPDNLQSSGVYAHYIPGLGTYFRQIGDIGDDDGAAFGKYGDARLDKAMQWLDETIAKHPASKIEAIQVAIFGFSRGATLARAFARRVGKRCGPDPEHAGKFVWPAVDKPFAISFLGLFDTVASVGIPASAGTGSLFVAKKWTDLEPALESRRVNGRSGLAAQAFGDLPGADPTPGMFDGHGSWAGNLRVPAVVTRTVHLVAMNEIRNSFPLDSLWDGTRLPDNVVEIVYPGAHSNIGGGYRPGEAGKSMTRGLLLSKIPLRKMYEEAVAAGIPLLPLDHTLIKEDFAFDPELKARFDRAMQVARPRADRLGDALLSFNQLYLAWRFRKIHLALRSQDAATITAQEARYRREGESINERMAALENAPERKAAERDMKVKQAAWQRASQHSPHFPHEKEEAAYRESKARFDAVNDAYLKERGRLRTLPDYSGELVSNLGRYDRQLLKDVAFLKAHQKETGAKLRPHYVALLQAHDREFELKQGLTDPLVIDFFDSFVHDSLAGFAKDVTLPSDPRCCYIGGDDELKYANNQPVQRRSVLGQA